MAVIHRFYSTVAVMPMLGKMLSAANNCITLLTNLSIEANNVDPDQTGSTVCQRDF